MPVTFESGDIFHTPGFRAFAHGCNCEGAMGKGIAVAFKQKWPRMYKEYRRQCSVGEFNLGDVFVWEEAGKTVFNLGTQRSWKTKAEIEAIKQALRSMIAEAEQRHIEEIALPRIGAGLGGIDWSDVRAVLEEIGGSTSVCLRVVETFVAGKALHT